MNTTTLFVLQFGLSLFVYALLAKWYLSPWLAGKSLRVGLMVLIIPHAMRHLGLAFLVPGMTGDSLPSSFATEAAFGDFIAGLLAILSLIALRKGWGWALPLVLVFNVFGTLDLLNALRQAEAVPHLMTTWYIPTFVVPALLVTHFMVFTRLYRYSRQRSCHLSDAAECIPQA